MNFDHHSESFAADWRHVYDEMRACPVARSEAHGGFWVVTGFEEVRSALLDRETYVCGRDLVFPGVAAPAPGGVTVPTNPFRMGMMEMDGPRAQALRRLILPWLSARSVEEHQGRLDELTTWLLDLVTPKGEMDLVDDLANPLPAIVTLDLLGLPLERWRTYADVLHAAAYRRQGSAHQVAALLDDLTETVENRRGTVATPTCVLDALILADVDGHTLTTPEVVELAFMLLNGGIDTSTAVIAHVLAHLDSCPGNRGRLLEHAELVPGYVDELVRRVSPGTGVARTVSRSTELGGVTLEAGDRVLLALGAANNDPAVYPDPDEVRVEGREPAHLAYGMGAHRCVGSGLAAAEITTVVRHVLVRIPDFRVDREAVVAVPHDPPRCRFRADAGIVRPQSGTRSVRDRRPTAATGRGGRSPARRGGRAVSRPATATGRRSGACPGGRSHR